MASSGRQRVSMTPFTLMELMIVALLVALVAAIAAPQITGFGPDARFQKGMRQVAGFIEIMRYRAMSLKKPIKLVYNVPENSYFVELVPERDADSGELDEAALEELRLVANHLPKDVSFTAVAFDSETWISDESVAILVTPDGRMSSHWVYISAPERSGTLVVNGLTGLVDIRFEHVDVIEREPVILSQASQVSF